MLGSMLGVHPVRTRAGLARVDGMLRPRRLRPVAALASVLIAALAASGCYTFSGITATKSSLKYLGKKSTVKVKSFGAPPVSERDVFFLLLGVPDEGTPDTGDDPLNPGAGWFDTTGVVYPKPRKLQFNDEIRDALVDLGGCGSFDLSEAPTDRFLVLATRKRAKQVSAARQVTSTYNLKQVGLATAPNPQTMLTVVGSWDDDGDGVVEPFELGCGGGAVHSFHVERVPGG